VIECEIEDGRIEAVDDHRGHEMGAAAAISSPVRREAWARAANARARAADWAAVLSAFDGLGR
jgi:hypothetical protein